MPGWGAAAGAGIAAGERRSQPRPRAPRPGGCSGELPDGAHPSGLKPGLGGWGAPPPRPPDGSGDDDDQDDNAGDDLVRRDGGRNQGHGERKRQTHIHYLEDTSRRSGRDPAGHHGVPPKREHLAPCPRSDRHQPGGLLPLPALPARPRHPGGPADVRGAPAGPDRPAGEPAQPASAVVDLPQRSTCHPRRDHRALPARDPARPGPVRPHRLHRAAAVALQPADFQSHDRRGDPGHHQADAALHGRADRLRKRNWTGKFRQQRHPDQRRADRGVPRSDLLSELTAARRRRDRPGKPDPRGRLCPPAGRGRDRSRADGHPPSRRPRPLDADRRRGANSQRRARPDRRRPRAPPGRPGALVVIGKVPPVPVTVIGTADNLSRFLPASLHVTGNFSNVKVGTNKVPVDVQNADPNITIVAASSVTVSVDDLGSSTQTVSIERVNTLPAGFHEQTAATTITPATVRVDGPKSQLSGIQAVVIVDLANVTAPGTTSPVTVHIWNASKKDVPQMTVTPPTVSVKMVIQADAVTLNKGVGFTITGQPASGYRMTNVHSAPLVVQASGLQNTLAGLLLLATDPVDITGQKTDVIRTVTIRPPDGVTVNQKTATVHVFISPIPGVSPAP